ncbi:hypothetical protein [Streptomyces sp. NPDC101234]|uniref:hypothetical protein n=1 Tax=Streptomyces sp. NPDC101234 TaxID=3366138 RepID=UPI00380665DC
MIQLIAEGVVSWDFEGTLAFRDGMWRGCLVEARTAITPGHRVTVDDVARGLHDGFPRHRPEMEHLTLSGPGAWWSALRPLFTNAYVREGVDAYLST